MTTFISQSAFIIRPADDLLDTYPAIGHASHQLASDYATSNFVSEERLQAMGQLLWQALDITADFEAARHKAGTAVLPILIESSQAASQRLPWETLYHPSHGFLGKSPAFTLCRQIPGHSFESQPLQPGPLRVLLFTSLPDDLDAEKARLDVEEEQAQVLEALTPLIKKGVVQLEMPDDGRLATLRTLLKETQPHLVFISGHGKFIEARANPHFLKQISTDIAGPPYAVFQFEDDWGASHFVAEDQIAAVFMGTQVRCVVLSACESGRGSSVALNNGLMWRLSQLGLPHVIGMRESVLDRAGTLFVRALCDALVQAEAIDVALQQGRQAITKPLAGSPWLKTDTMGLAEASLGQWCLPMLITQDRSQGLIKWQFTPQPPVERGVNVLMNTVSLPPRFLGRRSELRAIQSRLRQGKLRQLLITGPGGQGKTALAGKLALDLESRRGYRVLAYSARPENHWSDFVSELEFLLSEANAKKYDRMVPRFRGPGDRARLLLRLLLEQFDNKVVLFFDNLESLQEPQTRALSDDRIKAWIEAAQAWLDEGLILLLTSRWELPGWPEADLCRLTHASYGDFLQMARPALPLDFLARRDRLRQVYRTLHGNGRGLHLFAGAIQGMTLVEEERFLARLAAAEEELQTNMAIEQIVDQLEPEAYRLLQRLPAYQTPVPVEGIIRLGLDLPAPQPALAQLLAVSLVEQTEALAWQTIEYQLSPLVAAWLTKQGQLALAPAWLQAAADYLEYLFQNERRDLPQAILVHQSWRQAGEKEKADRFALDVIVGPLNRQGLYQTLLKEWLPDICQSDDRQIQAEALGQTGKQHLHLGNYSQALPLFQQSLKICQEIGDKSGEGTTLNNISQIFQAQAEYNTALKYLQQSLQIRQEIGDKSGEGITLNNISLIFQARGDYDTAMTYLQQSLQIMREIGDKSGEGTTLNNISLIFQVRGDYDTALTYLQRSLQICQEIGDKSGEGTTLNNISLIFQAQGDYDTALTYLQQSLQIRQEIGDKSGEGDCLNNISQIFKARGDYDTALTYLQQSLQIRQEIGDKSGEGTTLNNISQIFQARGDYDTALTYLQQSLQISQEIGDKSGEGTTLNNISQIFQARDDYDTALAFLQQSLQISQAIGDKSGEGTTLNNMATTAHMRGDYDTALAFLQQSLKIMREINNKFGEGTTLNNISQIFQAQGDYDTALSLFKQSLQIMREIGNKSGEGDILNNISTIYHARGNYDTALAFYQRSLQIRREIGNKSGVAESLNNISQIFKARGDYDTALHYLQQSLQIMREIGNKSGEGATLDNISQIFLARGDYDTALSLFKQSLQIRQAIGDKSGEGTTLNNISQIFQARGDYGTAITYLQQSLQISQAIGDKSGEGTTLNNISAIYHARGDYDTALIYLQQSLQICEEIGDVDGLCTTLFNMGHIHWQNEEIDEAVTAWVTVYRLAQPMQLAQVLEALAKLAPRLGLPPGLAGWAALAQRMGQQE